MADLKKRLNTNVAGEFFVDSTCIDCDTCRQLAPTVFDEQGEYSRVFHQPQDDAETRAATQALLACPTGSIGTVNANRAKEVMADFPMPIAEDVFYCGFNSPKSYGGNSYFIRHPEGNWLIDSPKFLPHLVQRFEATGGIRFIFLTHQDDVADAEKFAAHFGSTRIIHRAELSSQPDAEQVIDGTEPVKQGEDFLIIPTPGHTEGHCVLLYRNTFLLTGDHLWGMGEADTGHRLGASKTYNWHSWPLQKQSLARLLDYRFEWVLPGHGRRLHLSAESMHAELESLLARLG